MAKSYQWEVMDNEIEERFDFWWESEGRDYADKEGGQTCDLYLLREVFKTAWKNGAFVAQTEILKKEH